MGRHRGEPAAIVHRACDRDCNRARARACDWPRSVCRRDLWLAYCGPLDDSADGGAADPVHRVRARRALESGADRVRGRALYRARSGIGGREIADRAARAGTVARRLDLADRAAGGAAADHAAACRVGAADAWTGVPVSDLGRGDRRRRRARLSHLPDAALSGNGRDPALRRLDHAARLSDGLRARPDRAPQLPLGLCAGRAAMSALSVRDVWVEYGDQIVLERINIEIAAGAFVSVVGPSG